MTKVMRLAGCLQVSNQRPNAHREHELDEVRRDAYATLRPAWEMPVLTRPGRNDAVHARIGNRLTDMFIHMRQQLE